MLNQVQHDDLLFARSPFRHSEFISESNQSVTFTSTYKKALIYTVRGEGMFPKYL